MLESSLVRRPYCRFGVTRYNPLPFEQFQYPRGDGVSAM
jgi:hypothetical protein